MMPTNNILHQNVRVTIANQWRAEARLHDISMTSAEICINKTVFRADYFGEGSRVRLGFDLPIYNRNICNHFFIHVNGTVRYSRVETSTDRIRVGIDIFPDAQIKKMLRMFINQGQNTAVILN